MIFFHTTMPELPAAFITLFRCFRRFASYVAVISPVYAAISPSFADAIR